MTPMEKFQQESWAKKAEIMKTFGPEKRKAIPLFEDCLCYPIEPLIELRALCLGIQAEQDPDKRAEMLARFVTLRDSIERLPDAPQRIYLWPEGKMPAKTVYTDPCDYRYNHAPDFAPYMFAFPMEKDAVPEGAVIVIPGGDQGESTLQSYQVCRQLTDTGYRCFLLHNRVNHNPWCGEDCGVDTARAIRYIRAQADEYRIPADRVAVAGFSNGGLTGEACIQYYSGEQKVSDHFPDYIPDELDDYYGAPDAFLCIYGPRFVNSPFDFSKVVYPPTFFAVGRNDNAMNNLHYTYPTLIEHGVPVEVHTFAGTPHGTAGISLMKGGVSPYPNFELWVPLADAFMQDVYQNR